MKRFGSIIFIGAAILSIGGTGVFTYLHYFGAPAVSKRIPLTALKLPGGYHSVPANAHVSPDGQKVVISYQGRKPFDASNEGKDHHIRIWETQTGKLLKDLEGHTFHISSVQFSPDGQRILSASMDGTVRVWDVQTGASLLTLVPPNLNPHPEPVEKHKNTVFSAQYSGDGKVILVLSMDKYPRIFDAQTGQLLKTLGENIPFGEASYRLNQPVAISSDHQKVIQMQTENEAWIWDVQSGEHTTTLHFPRSAILERFIFSPDGTKILAHDANHSVSLFDSHTGTLVQTFQASNAYLHQAQFLPKSQYVILGGYPSVDIWDINSGQHVLNIDRKEKKYDGVLALGILAGCKRLATVGENEIVLWDMHGKRDLVIP